MQGTNCGAAGRMGARRGRHLRCWLETRIFASALASVYLMAAGATQAQQAEQAPASSGDTVVVVHGYRACLEQALDHKRRSNLPIESIEAEDIGKMPDQNVAC